MPRGSAPGRGTLPLGSIGTRRIFSQVVPWAEVWRTGANVANQLRTDRGVEIGGVPVPAGTHTPRTIPSPNG